MHNLEDIGSGKQIDSLVFSKSISKSKIYSAACNAGVVVSIEESIMNPDYHVVKEFITESARPVDLCRQLIETAAGSDSKVSYIKTTGVNMNTLRVTFTRIYRKYGFDGKYSLGLENGFLVFRMTKKVITSSLRDLIDRLDEDESVVIPYEIHHNPEGLSSMVHSIAGSKRIKVATRKTPLGLRVTQVVQTSADDKRGKSNVALRMTIDRLTWDVPTPLVTPDKSALLSTLAAQHPLRCFTVRKGIITKRSAIIKRIGGQNVLMVYGQPKYRFNEMTDNDRKIISDILKPLGKTLEDL